MRRPSPPNLAALHDPARYALIAEFSHAGDLVPHVQRYLRRRSWIGVAYWLASALGLAAVALLARRSGLPGAVAFATACAGAMLGYVLLVPLHEYVHGLAYRALGARAVTVRYDWRRLTAYCAADRFPVTGRGFTAVCLAPLLVLTPPLAVAAMASPGPAGGLLGGAALLHLGACSGDVAFVNFLWAHRARRVVTYDDVAAGRTYFFAAGPRDPDTCVRAG